MAQKAPAPVAYTVSLRDPAHHLVHVAIELPPGNSTRELQLPAWNGLYEIRDFAQYISSTVSVSGPAGQGVTAYRVNDNTWRLEDAAGGARIEYNFRADEPGPFGAQLSSEHAFLNLAWLLMYPVAGRALPVTLRFTEVPAGWHIATALAGGGERFRASSYDQLVDAPVEISRFRGLSFEQGGAHYRIAIDADPATYDPDAILAVVRRVVSAAVDWMQDCPFDHYVFIYHFRNGPGLGGMEHSYSTAIDVSSDNLRSDPDSIANLTAHEFFHLWNVKRIRPASLEPVDYTRENFTRALWFSEGVTSTVADYLDLRAGLASDQDYLQQLASMIEVLENRPAHLYQSAEDSSLETWYDKYPFYELPQQSISYYNKGEILGVLLDLAIREASDDSKSLRDLMQWMNQHYAKAGKFFPDSDGVRQAAEAITGKDFHDFFRRFVAGVEPLPYDHFFQTVGLRLQQHTATVPDFGFRVAFSGAGDRLAIVTSVAGDSAAERAGLEAGDTILEVNGKPSADDWNVEAGRMRAGEVISLKLNDGREIAFEVAARERKVFELVDSDHITPEQRARRTAWLRGDSGLATVPKN